MLSLPPSPPPPPWPGPPLRLPSFHLVPPSTPSLDPQSCDIHCHQPHTSSLPHWGTALLIKCLKALLQQPVSAGFTYFRTGLLIFHLPMSQTQHSCFLDKVTMPKEFSTEHVILVVLLQSLGEMCYVSIPEPRSPQRSTHPNLYYVLSYILRPKEPCFCANYVVPLFYDRQACDVCAWLLYPELNTSNLCTGESQGTISTGDLSHQESPCC